MSNDRKIDRRAANRARHEDRQCKVKAYSRAKRHEEKRAARNWAMEAA